MKINTNPAITEYSEKMGQMLMSSGLSKSEAAETIIYLDTMVNNAITEDLVDSLPESKQDEFDKLLDKNPTVGQIMEFLGMKDADFTKMYLEKSQIFLANLTKNLPGLKDKLNPANQNQDKKLICLGCEYVGTQKICPRCKFLMEEQCDKCYKAKSFCLCEAK